MSQEPNNRGRVRTWLVVAGGSALLAAAIIDTISVIGRHIDLPFLGSIELVQAAILLSGSAALIVATLAGSHAVVRLLVERLPHRMRHGLERINRVASASFFLGLLAGSVWIMGDMWSGHEESELLHIPYIPLRFVLCCGLAVVAVVFLARALRRTR